MKVQLQNRVSSIEQTLFRQKAHLANVTTKEVPLYREHSKLKMIEGLKAQINQKEQQLSQIQSQLIPKTTELQKHVNQQSVLNDLTGKLQQAKSQLIEQKSEYDDLLTNLDVNLTEFSNQTGLVINTSDMTLKNLPTSEIKNTELAQEACTKKNLQLLNEILDKVDDVNAADSNGVTLLMYSLKHGFFDGINFLLEKGADVTLQDHNGYNTLSYACILPHLKYIELIINQFPKDELNNKSTVTGNNPAHLLLANVANSKVYSDELLAIRKSDPKSKDNSHIYFTGNFVMNSNLNIDGDGIVNEEESKQGDKPTLTVNGGSVSIVLGAREDGYTVNQQKALLITEILLKHGVDMRESNHEGYEPFFYVCLAKQKYLAQKLAQLLSIKIENLDTSGWQGAVCGMRLGDMDLLKRVIETKQEALTATDGTGTSLVLFASQVADTQSLQELLKVKADPNIPNNNLDYALAEAVSKNHVEVFNLLLNAYEIDLNTRSTVFAVTALYLAAQDGKSNMVEMLVKKGALLDIERLDTEFTPLHMTMVNGHISIAQSLIKAGASIDCFAKNGFNAWHIAAFKGYTEILEQMYNKGITVDTPSKGLVCSALWFAAQEGQLDAVKFLLSKEAESNAIRDSDGRTALQANICCKKNIDVVETLISANADVNKPDKANFTPLYMAVEKQDLQIIKFLLEHGAKLELAGDSGDQPIHMASALCNIFIMKILLDKGASLDIANNTGSTLLHEVIDKENVALQSDPQKKIDATKYLLARGAKTDLPNKEGKTPIDLAKTDLPEVLEFLEHPENIGLLTDLESALLGNFNYDEI